MKIIDLIRKIFKGSGGMLSGLVLTWIISRSISITKKYCEKQGVNFEEINQVIEEALLEVISQDGFQKKWETMADKKEFINELIVFNLKKVLPSAFPKESSDSQTSNFKEFIMKKTEKMIEELKQELKDKKEELEKQLESFQNDKDSE